MNPIITTLASPFPSVHAQEILHERGFKGVVLTIPAGGKTSEQHPHHKEEEVLFGLAGETTIQLDDLAIMLEKDKAVLIPQDRKFVLQAAPEEASKLLRVVVPSRRVVQPELTTIGAS